MEVTISLMSLVANLDKYYKQRILESFLEELEDKELEQLQEDIGLELAARSVEDAD